MKKSRPVGIMPVLMIFLILIQCQGCYSYRKISVSDLPAQGKYHYVIYSGASSYKLNDAAVSDGILSGRIVGMADKPQKIKIYLDSDSALTIGDAFELSVPVANISKVEKEEINPLLTGISISGAILILIITVAAMSYSFSLDGFEL